MTRCESCGYEFTNFLMRRNCPRCDTSLKREGSGGSPATVSQASRDDGFDSTGFAIGMMTGVPISPTHGVSVGSMLGAAMHSNPSHSTSHDTTPSSPTPSCDTSSSSSSSSYDSSSSSSSYDSSSSCSYDSGSSSSGSSDSGGSW